MLSMSLSSLGFTFASKGWFGFGAGAAVAFFFMLAFAPMFITIMRRWQSKGQPIRENGPKAHLEKAGTPTMGGILILAAIFTSSVLFMDLYNPIPWVALLSLLLFGAIGFADDFGKVTKRSAYAGLSARGRLALGGGAALVLAFLADYFMPAYVPELSVFVPLFHWFLPLGIFYFVFAYFVIVGSANAANITDGLDGMLSKILLPVFLVLFAALYGATHVNFLPGGVFLPEAVGLYPVLGAAIGAIVGFLWFNAKPAQLFMGDVGSLALGGFMGTVAMQLKSEIAIGIAAMMMVLILLSTFSQMIVFKLTKGSNGVGKRIFKMAPLHHHFELSGWTETKIVERFFVMSIIFSAIALGVMKL
ncbi:MAG: phospho-N-acetylmuramoyl-pentapeptide-transferase [Alphaproteobacteria bacterium]|nr:phospho-N-acetylmuramoyl-pentapeptide-transferase [Alphaproteobacteria bacterium]